MKFHQHNFLELFLNQCCVWILPRPYDGIFERTATLRFSLSTTFVLLCNGGNNSYFSHQALTSHCRWRKWCWRGFHRLPQGKQSCRQGFCWRTGVVGVKEGRAGGLSGPFSCVHCHMSNSQLQTWSQGGKPKIHLPPNNWELQWVLHLG